MIVAVIVAVSPAGMAGIVSGEVVTSQLVGGVAVSATSVIGAVPVLAISKACVVADPAEPLADRTSFGVDSVNEKDPVTSIPRSAATVRSPARASTLIGYIEGGRPEKGNCGAAPEWFYKGNGTALRAIGEVLQVPGYAEDGGEEAEIAGIYVIDRDGRPRRIGMAPGNEFSDHTFEKRNYLNLAGSKLRQCSLGPELVIDGDFDKIPGRVSIERLGRTIWEHDIATGEEAMCHSIPNIEHHHFKFEAHRRPGDVHVHYFGADSLSFAAGVQLEDGDVMVVEFAGFGRPLRNVVTMAARQSEPVSVLSIA